MEPHSAGGLAISAALAAVLVALAGCAGSSTSPPTAPEPSASATSSGPTAANPADLVGSWHLAAPDEEAAAILTIGDRVDGGLLLWRDCGFLEGDWRANRRGMFVGALTGGSGDCFSGGGPSPIPAWLDRVVGFRPDGEAELLVDSSGSTVARLTPGASPAPPQDGVPEYASPPVVTAEMRRSFEEPAPLPAGVAAADRRALLGRWVPVENAPRRPKPAFVRFTNDGSYDGSDGCNGAGGRYVLGPDGVVLATSGPSTLIGCHNSQLPGWVAQSGRLGLRSGRLVFVDPDGKVLGEAERA